MHDPMTVAFDIRWPIPQKEALPDGRVRKRRQVLVTIWHNDPESDGSDDSCGWSAPNLTDRERKIINEVIEWEKGFPYYSSPYLPLTQVDPKYEYPQQIAGDCLAHVASAWLHIAWTRDGRRVLTAGEWWAVVNLATNPQDNLRAVLADTEAEPDDRVRRFFACVTRAYLKHRRPWWRHPRWHVHHWSIQVHPVQNLKRWLFSRCAGCGKRFAWGYSPTSARWEGDGPRWFRGEPGVYHSDCYRRGS